MLKALLTRLWWERVTPFGLPVVPEVNWRQARMTPRTFPNLDVAGIVHPDLVGQLSHRLGRSRSSTGHHVLEPKELPLAQPSNDSCYLIFSAKWLNLIVPGFDTSEMRIILRRLGTLISMLIYSWGLDFQQIHLIQSIRSIHSGQSIQPGLWLTMSKPCWILILYLSGEDDVTKHLVEHLPKKCMWWVR